jgi:hypothetical protein
LQVSHTEVSDELQTSQPVTEQDEHVVEFRKYPKSQVRHIELDKQKEQPGRVREQS